MAKIKLLTQEQIAQEEAKVQEKQRAWLII